ncbi:MAG: NAD(P)-dependent oxidoreductase [Dehalococcoidia bacterium]|nr:MAG: NAD(P)-dependent oxidoreductase [Dehalococcoidia bacterium]
MRVLITGAAGNLGPGVCRAFLEDGFNVRVLLHRKRLKSLGANLEVVWGDLTQPDSVMKAMEGVDAVVHLAGVVQPLTEQNPQLASRVNVGGTQTIVDLIKERGGSIPFVFTSSTAVFGPCPDATECLHPDKNPCNPTSVYARTKVQAEDLIKESGIDYLILRLTSIPYLRIRLSDVKTHMLTIPLKNRLEFCHPDEVALAILNAVKNFDMVKCKTLMIGGGPSQQMLFEDMLGVLLGTFGLPLPPRHKFAKEPYALDWYDTSRSQELLKFQHKTLDDYTRDLARQFPAPLLALMRYFIGPVFGRLIVRLI